VSFLTEADTGGLPLASLMLIDAECDRFEETSRAGGRPDLASFLNNAPPPVQARLFHDLLTIELEFCFDRGETPDLHAYSGRFPEYPEVIAAVFARFGRADKSLPSSTDHAVISPQKTRLGQELPRADLDPTALKSLRSAGYEILGELGRGGMGVVYLARNVALNRPCALKMILASLHAGSTAVARFRTEAEAVARLRHPGIVQIYHIGDAGGLPFLELEYLAGGNLDRTLDGTPRPPADAARLVEALARAIAEAHGKAIVHRDLKPANVLLDLDGSPKVADFGLAKVLDSDSDLTRTQTVLGSPSYMAPEQAEGRSDLVGATSDIYALGAILYTLLVGFPPFRAATALETLAQVKSAEPVSPSRIQPGLPRDIETICLKCLEKVPGRRYATAEALAEDLRRYQSGESILARPAPAWERAWKWARRRPALAAALAVVVVAAGILLGGVLYYNARLQAMLQRTQVAELAAVDRGKLAIDAYSRLVSDVQEKLGDTAATRSIRQDLLTTAIRGLDEIARSPGAFAPDLYLAVAHQKLGEILRQVGRADDARLQLDRARLLAEDLAASDPGNLAVAECLRDAYLGIGELIVRDEHAREASGYFRSALKQARAIMTAAPARAGARLGLAEAYHRLGRALDSAGDLAEAKECFRTMQELAERWVDDEPKNAVARDMLASSYLRLARVRRYYKEFAAAEVAFRDATAIARQLWTAEPKNIVYKTHLALALIDSASLSIDMHKYRDARPLFVESEHLYRELAEADPEDREAQVWLVHVQYQFGRLERMEEHFAQAEEVFRRALDRLRQLDGEGRLEGRPAFKYRHMSVLKKQVAFCIAAPKVLEDASVDRSQPLEVAIDLLRLRAKRLAELGRHVELAATAETLCAFEDGDWEDQFHLAYALASCIPYFTNGRSTGLKGGDRSDLQQRCKDRAIAAVARAIEQGFPDPHRLEYDSDLDLLRDAPDFRELIERFKSHQTPREVRYPTR